MGRGQIRSSYGLLTLTDTFQTMQREPKMLKLERGQSTSKISFDDTVEIDRVHKLSAGRTLEPDSSDEEQETDRSR